MARHLLFGEPTALNLRDLRLILINYQFLENNYGAHSDYAIKVNAVWFIKA